MDNNRLVFVVSVNTENYMKKGFWGHITQISENSFSCNGKIAKDASLFTMENGEKMLKVEIWD